MIPLIRYKILKSLTKQDLLATRLQVMGTWGPTTMGILYLLARPDATTVAGDRRLGRVARPGIFMVVAAVAGVVILSYMTYLILSYPPRESTREVHAVSPYGGGVPVWCRLPKGENMLGKICYVMLMCMP